MNKKSNLIVSRALVILILIILLITITVSKLLNDTFHQGRAILLEDGAELLTLDPSGQPWVADDQWIGQKPEIEVKTLENGSWISFTSGKNGLPSDVVKSIAADLNGNIWVGTWQSGLLMYDGKKWTTFTAQNSGLSTNYIKDIEVDSLNQIWICYGFDLREPIKGVTVIDGNDWHTFTTGNSDLLSDEVEVIAIDLEGRVWMGMRGDTQGVSILEAGQWISYTPDNSGLRADAIADIAFDADGRVWIVTYGEVDGINIFDGKMWEFYSLNDMGVGKIDWLTPGIHIDQYQRIWISLEFGARIYDGQKWVDWIGEDGGTRGIGDLANDEQGRIWITSGGLFTIDQEYPITALWETRQLRIFIMRGWFWYLVIGLACILLAVLLGLTSPLAAAILASAFSTSAWSVLFRDPNLFHEGEFANPGIYISAGALIGGMIGQWNKTLAKQSGPKKYIPLIIGFAIGSAIGFCQLLPYIFSP